MRSQSQQVLAIALGAILNKMRCCPLRLPVFCVNRCCLQCYRGKGKLEVCMLLYFNCDVLDLLR